MESHAETSAFLRLSAKRHHPTMEEGLRTALRMVAHKLPPCSISDLAGCGPMGAEALE